jgi:hypothetical protein
MFSIIPADTQGRGAVIESIEEPVEVLARFERGAMTPFRFRWNRSVFKIAKVTGQWEDRDGQYRRCYYAVITDANDYFELRFHLKDLSWVLSKTSIDA